MIARMLTVGREIAGITCRGGRLKNEDSLTINLLPDGYLIAVADGIGGHRAGDQASSLAISALKDTFLDSYIGGFPIGRSHHLLREGFAAADHAVRSEAVGDRSGMGTTLAAAYIRRETAIIAHTGDSRAYHLSGRVVSVTRDHSLVADLIDQGLLDPVEAIHHPLRSYITKSIGGDFQVDSAILSLHPGDVLLLASDGFYGCLNEGTLSLESLTDHPAEMLRRLMRRVLRVTKDNATAIIYRSPV